MFAVIFVSLAALPAREVNKDALLTNKAKDIHLVSGREGPILDYFRGNQIVVGSVLADGFKKVVETKKPLDQFFVNYASHNDGKNGSTFGAFLLVAPASPAVVKLLNQHKPDGKKPTLTLILRRDDKNGKLYHVVGCTDRTPVGFFDSDKKNDTDGFSQKDLRYRPAKK